MHPEHERYYGLSMDAPVIGCTGITSVVMVWAEGLRGSGSFMPTARYYPLHPPQRKAQKPRKTEYRNPPVCKTRRIEITSCNVMKMMTMNVMKNVRIMKIMKTDEM